MFTQRWKFVVLVLLLILVIPLGLVSGARPSPGESAGNNLSFPVIWAEGVTKVLREPPADPGYLLAGEWFWTWGVDPVTEEPLSCAPSPTDESLCIDNTTPGTGAVKTYVQKDANNIWKASTVNGVESPVVIDWIDWGDNLESVDWYTRSKVRTEVVLIKDLETPLTAYEMAHVSGWGIDEVWGVVSTEKDAAGRPMPRQTPGNQATVYSPCARLTIQKLLVDRSLVDPETLKWDSVIGEWVEVDDTVNVIEPAFINKPVWVAGDGPGYYSAEINVKGKIIYGYTWDVAKTKADAGDYRITFSLDGVNCSALPLNTSLVDGTTEILVPLEEEAVSPTLYGPSAFVAESSDETGGGGVPQIDFADNLTYIDVRIKDRANGGRPGR